MRRMSLMVRSVFRPHRWSVLLPLVACCGCLVQGPVALQSALKPGELEVYSRYLVEEDSPRTAYLRWRADETGRPAEEVLAADEALSETGNPLAAPPDAWSLARGALFYKMHCLSCHGENADGHGPSMPETLSTMDFHGWGKRFSLTYFGSTPGKWFGSVRDGKKSRYLDAKGEPYAMPAFGESLAREQIWLALTYLMSGA